MGGLNYGRDNDGREDVAKPILDELEKFDPLTLLFLNSLSELLIVTDEKFS